MVSGSMRKKLYLQLPHWMKARSVEIQAGRETCLVSFEILLGCSRLSGSLEEGHRQRPEGLVSS